MNSMVWYFQGSGISILQMSLEPFRRTLEKESVGGTPILGICLGMEMFLEKSEEGKWMDSNC